MSEGTELIGQNVRGRQRIEIDPNSPTPGFDYLCATVRDPQRPDHERARAARELLPFEKPKLSATALMHAEGDFADRLQRAIERSALANGEGAKVINGDGREGSLIEHEPQGLQPQGLRRI